MCFRFKIRILPFVLKSILFHWFRAKPFSGPQNNFYDMIYFLLLDFFNLYVHLFYCFFRRYLAILT